MLDGESGTNDLTHVYCSPPPNYSTTSKSGCDSCPPHTPPSYLRSNVFVVGGGLTLSALQAVELWRLRMYAYTHTHTLPPPLNMISSYVCALHISQQAEIHPPTQTHSKSTPKHSNAPSTKYSGRTTTIHYLSISPNGWIIHYNSRNDNQLCVINMNYIHTHHTKPTTPCTYLSFGTYASGDEIHVLLRCELQITLTHLKAS